VCSSPFRSTRRERKYVRLNNNWMRTHNRLMQNRRMLRRMNKDRVCELGGFAVGVER